LVPKIVCRHAVPASVVPVKLGSANCVPDVALPGNASLLKLKPTSPENSETRRGYVLIGGHSDSLIRSF